MPQIKLELILKYNKDRSCMIKNVKTISLLSLCLTCLPVWPYESLVKQSLNHHPQLRQSQAELSRALAEVSSQRSAYLPKLGVDASTGLRFNDDTQDIHRLALNASQLLYDGWSTPSLINSARLQAMAQYYQLRSKEEQIAFSAVLAYEEMQRTQQLLTIAQTSLELHRRVQQQVNNRVSRGAAPRMELEQINGRLALAESNLLVESANYQDAVDQYQRITGTLPPNELSHISPQWRLVPVNESIDALNRQNPQLKASRLLTLASEQQTRAAKGQYQPQLQLRASHNLNVDQELNQESRIELSLSYQLFNGGGNQSRVAERLFGALAEDNRHQDLCLELRQSYLQTQNEHQRAQEQLRHLRQHRLSSERIRQAYRDQFDLGQRSLLEVLDSESEFLNASRALIIGEFDLKISAARMVMLQGELLQQLNLASEPAPTNLNQIKASHASLCPNPTQTIVLPQQQNNDLDLPDFQRPEPTPPPRPITEPPLLSFSSTVSFDSSSWQLSNAGQAFLRQIADQVQQLNQIDSIIIKGHTDSSGQDSLNQQLSEQRAESAKNFLISQGIEGNKIIAQGLGSSQPIASNDTEFGRQQNRRIEVEVRGR